MPDADLAITTGTDTTWQLSPGEFGSQRQGFGKADLGPRSETSFRLAVFGNMNGFAVVGLAGRVSLNSRRFQIILWSL